VNFLQLPPTEKISAVLSLVELGEEKFKYLVMVTEQGIIKKVDIDAFENVRRSGLIAIKLKNGDRLKWVKPSTGNDDIILVTAYGQAIRFKEKNVRPMGRTAAGIRGIKLRKDDKVVGMDVVSPLLISKNLLDLLVVTINGFGKRTNLKNYKVQGRGGIGIKTAKVTSKTGQIVSAQVINSKEDRDLIIISKFGQVIRLPFKSISVLGRATQGVRLMRFKEKEDTVASVTFV
jgi:DNA gyrase subunit A